MPSADNLVYPWLSYPSRITTLQKPAPGAIPARAKWLTATYDHNWRTTHSTYPPPIATIAKHVLEGLTGRRGLAYSRDTSSAQW
jgi:hypothetical protein